MQALKAIRRHIFAVIARTSGVPFGLVALLERPQ